jgi:hypothetical protein
MTFHIMLAMLRGLAEGNSLAPSAVSRAAASVALRPVIAFTSDTMLNLFVSWQVRSMQKTHAHSSKQTRQIRLCKSKSGDWFAMACKRLSQYETSQWTEIRCLLVENIIEKISGAKSF